MTLLDPASGLREARVASHALSRFFPTPELLAPRAAGVDISDASIKWLALERAADGFHVATYGEETLNGGIVVSGAVQDADALASALRDARERLGGITCAHAALPEEAAYVFEMHVPVGTTREQTERMIEFEFEGRVPIPPEAAVYDYDVVQRRGEDGEDISVVVFPRELAERYAESFAKAGIALLSLEIEARSIARAVSSREENEPVTLLVDFGRARTGLAVLKRGIPIFTTTVEVGGEVITHALQEALSISTEDAIKFRNEQGLLTDGGKRSPGAEAVLPAASALADEVARHFHYWDTRRDEHGERMTPVGRIVLLGGSANLRGLPDYLAGRVQAPASLGNVWRHVCDFDSYIPPIDRRTSLRYATAVGLALRSFRV